jgi:hypothetical protein
MIFGGANITKMDIQQAEAASGRKRECIYFPPGEILTL